MKGAFLAIAALITAQSADARAVKIERNSPALEFSYSYPSQAAAIPALRKRFEAEMNRRYRHSYQLALEDRKTYKEQGRGEIHDFYAMEWTLGGETPRLLSLQNSVSTFTGGAHPNTAYGALLWDRRLNGEITVDELFKGPNALAAQTRARYCAALDAERKKRRQGEAGGLPEFNACPKFSELASAPVDTNRNGVFDAIQFVASPYTAGPYAEGEYAITVPVTSQLIGAVKPVYRTSFERQRQ
jgi:hypothetical protein